jgi:hypothetical protein
LQTWECSAPVLPNTPAARCAHGAALLCHPVAGTAFARTVGSAASHARPRVSEGTKAAARRSDGGGDDGGGGGDFSMALVVTGGYSDAREWFGDVHVLRIGNVKLGDGAAGGGSFAAPTTTDAGVPAEGKSALRRDTTPATVSKIAPVRESLRGGDGYADKARASGTDAVNAEPRRGSARRALDDVNSVVDAPPRAEKARGAGSSIDEGRVVGAMRQRVQEDLCGKGAATTPCCNCSVSCYCLLPASRGSLCCVVLSSSALMCAWQRRTKWRTCASCGRSWNRRTARFVVRWRRFVMRWYCCLTVL